MRTSHAALTLVVSCCNRDGALWLVSINPGKFEPRVEEVLPSPCTGIARGQKGIYVGHPDGVRAFGPDMRRTPEADLELPGSDVHDVKVSPTSNLLVAETGHDRLASYTGGGTAVSVWKPTADCGDRCHLNSTTFLDGALLVAMFDAEGRGEPWGDRLDGMIAEVNPLRPGEFKPLWRGVEHPHSLVAVDGELWWCDSRRRRVMRNGTEVVRLPGYTRGLAVTEAWVIVGQSRSDNHRVKIEGFGSCGVWCYPRDGGELGEPLVVELPSTEVYDVLPISAEEASNMRAGLLAQKSAAPAAARLHPGGARCKKERDLTTSALRYHLQFDLRDKNMSQTQLAFLTGLNKKVLEVGPATGYLTEVLVRRGCRVTAIEQDEAAGEIAAKFCERMIVSDVEELDFAATFGDERFDVVMFGDVLEHLVHPQDVLSQVAGFLNPKGYVVASVPNMAHGSIRLALLNGEFRYTEMGLLDRTHLRFFTKESLRSMFREAGYVIRAWRRTVVDPFATELQLREADYPPHLVASLRNEPLALTYQFVVKAYPAKRRANRRTSDPVSSGRPATEVLKALWQREKESAERDATLIHREQLLAEKDAALAEKDAALAEKDAALADQTEQVAAIRQSRGYRILESYRQRIHWLFPADSWRGRPYRGLRRGVSWLLGFRNPQPAIIRRALKARRNYGAKALVGKSIAHLAGKTVNVLDPVAYALAVDWRSQRSPQLIVRQPLNIDSPTINWVIPTVGEGGGHLNIFRFVRYLAQRGFQQRIYEMPVGRTPRSSRDELTALIRRLYDLSMPDVYLDFEDMLPSDITMATSWHTAYPVFKFAETRKKLYLVQDLEPLFTPTGTESALAENTYRFGFHGVTAGRWLAERLTRDFNMECDYFNLAVDPETYFPRNLAERKKVFFYARPATPRRGYDLGVKALEIFHSRNPDYQIVFAGGELDGMSLPFPATTVGYTSEQKLNDLYNESAAALVVSLTNCSLLPLDIMATGCPVVTTTGENNEKVLPPDSAIFVVPSPHHLAEALEDAVRHPPPRESLSEKASQFSWEDEAVRLDALFKRLLRAQA